VIDQSIIKIIERLSEITATSQRAFNWLIKQRHCE